MADNSGLIKMGIAGAVAWYAYSQGWLSFLGIGTAAAAAPATAAAPAASPVAAAVPPLAPPVVPPVTAPAASATPSLDALGAQLVRALGSSANAAGVGPDAYNAVLTQIYPAAGPLPDPNTLFAGSGWARPQGMTFPVYWTATAPWLKANKGLSGYGPHGLGGYAGLGAIAMRHGWA
jgi:hypothetical protein